MNVNFMNVKRGGRRLVLALSLAFTGGALVLPLEASADNLVWHVKSNYKYRVQISFYSLTHHREWPGNGQAWGLNDDDVHEYNLQCRTGEKICFGAWVTGNAGTYWGVGADNKHSCESCCYVCGAGETRQQDLNP
jgi:hypothetical protein